MMNGKVDIGPKRQSGGFIISRMSQCEYNSHFDYYLTVSGSFFSTGISSLTRWFIKVYSILC